jgi:hypothetical protein
MSSTNYDKYPYAKAFEDMGYRIDESLPECEMHGSQMMWNSNNEPECVVCTGNDLVIMVVEA